MIRGKTAIAMVIILLCAALVGSFLFIAFGSFHDCDHDDCEVCRALDVCIHSIRCGSAVIAASAVLTALCLIVRAAAVFGAPVIRTATLISLRTELRN
ncbi:MAG: hypothetical protein IK093_14985 [Ruminiclostridium sp.]|nr:hypothetical protein [Ruminiclostridium sp.]